MELRYTIIKKYKIKCPDLMKQPISLLLFHILYSQIIISQYNEHKETAQLKKKKVYKN